MNGFCTLIWDSATLLFNYQLQTGGGATCTCVHAHMHVCSSGSHMHGSVLCTNSSPQSCLSWMTLFFFLPKCSPSISFFITSARVLVAFLSQVASRFSLLFPLFSWDTLAPEDAKICPHNLGHKEISTTLYLKPHFPFLVPAHWVSSHNWSPIHGLLPFTRSQDKQVRKIME